MISELLPADFILNHLWQSTLFAAAAALLALFFRKNHARVRYALWLAASFKFLIPFSLFVTIGHSIDLGRQSPVLIAQPALTVFQDIGQPFDSPDPSRAITASVKADNSTRTFVFAAWIFGCLAVLALYLVKGWSIRSTACKASPTTEGRAFEALQRLELITGRRSQIRLASSSASMEPGVFGILRPLLLLPAGIPERLSASELEAILAHELAHVHRRDNLIAAVHMFIEALFWFHPMVWWLGAKLVQERERACDEEVLRLGKDPQAYAEGILKVCELYLESPLACVAGVTGSNMKTRIREIMTHQVGSRLSFAKKALLAAFAIAVVAAPLIIGLLNAPLSRAQSRAESKPAFEVASVKPSKDRRGISIQMHPAGRLAVNGAPLPFLIAQAYEIQPFQISGGPTWTYSSAYDIEAKSSGPVSPAQIKLMLQSLLEERFKLKMHREKRDMPVYELVVPKGGQELKITKNDKGSGEPIPPLQPPIGPDGKPMVQPPGSVWQLNGQLQGKAIQLDEVAKTLSRILGRTIIDKTGLTGAYDFSLKWTPENIQANALNTANNSAPSADLSEPSILTAIQEQLGLKVEPSKDQGEFFIIDSVEKPSEN
jgi:bla regulator protein blaR1